MKGSNLLEGRITARNYDNPFSAERVLQALEGAGLISAHQREEIWKKRGVVQRNLERELIRRRGSQAGRAGVIRSMNIIDVIAVLKLKRADDSQKPLDEEAIYQALAGTWNIPFKKIDPLKLDLNLATTTIPHTFARKHLVLPLSKEDGWLTVATSNPFNVEVMEDIARASHSKVRPVVTTKSDIIKLIAEFFGFQRSIVAAEHQFAGPSVDLGNLEQYVRLKSADELPSNDQHIVHAVHHPLAYAFDQRASDIHIEPKRETTIVRMRIDGVLHTVYNLPKNVHPAIISRIKTISRLARAEKRKPQDGRIKTDRGGGGSGDTGIYGARGLWGKGGHEDHGPGDPFPEPGKARVFSRRYRQIPAVYQYALRYCAGLRTHRER